MQVIEPNEDLQNLDILVGKWELSGDVKGTVTYEWMEGRFFLIQHVDFEGDDGSRIKGIEIIGHERPFMAEPSEEIKSRYYGSGGETIDYVYEMEDGTLSIWAGAKGSPAYYRGTFSEDRNVLTGAWHYPGGDGYEAISTRIT